MLGTPRRIMSCCEERADQNLKFALPSKEERGQPVPSPPRMSRSSRVPIARRAVRLAVLAVFTTAILGAYVPSALAYNESGTVDPAKTQCTDCHDSSSPTSTTTYGPHGGYTTTSNKCSTCHSTHTAGGGKYLLPKATIKATCETCHDGTGGEGVYGVLRSRGVTPTAEHRIDVSNAVPGGDPVTGGSRVTTFSGESGYLSCDDCHSPHGALEASRTVKPFAGDRIRVASSEATIVSNRLLRTLPTGATTPTADYGSDWCLGCHQGRSTEVTMTANHPTDSSLTTTTPFTYSNVALVATDTLTTHTAMGPMARSNRGYLMPDPRSAEQTGHAPICQQCHEDARNVGTLTTAGADPATYTVTSVNGTSVADNPRFTVFPHESANEAFLVEPQGQLCGNCHIVEQVSTGGHGK
jgi:predicted CXXCH cytochrome family protein